MTSQQGFGLRNDRVMLWTTVAIGVPVAAGAVYYLSRNMVPYQYQYRPGTISGWLADMLSRYSKHRRSRRPVRVYMDGCFDMMHYGHANALRQARVLGDELVVGLVPDNEILRCKGPPVMDEEERYTLVDANKWVNEIITGVPYDLNPKFIDELFTKHRIDYIIHGDDPCLLPDGSDAYAHAKELGRFKMIKRTEGVSTTDIVGRMIMCTRVNRLVQNTSRTGAQDPLETHPLAKQFSFGHDRPDSMTMLNNAAPMRTTLSRFMPTSRRLVQFSNGKTAPADANIVYIDGAFDVFHPGHVKILQEAKKVGDFLLVGLHTDEEVQARRGPHLPIMNLHERSLSVLACKYVDEVIIGAPSVITEDLINTFNISLVVRGTLSETSQVEEVEPSRYRLPKQRKMFKELKSPSSMTTRTIIQRIVSKQGDFEARNARKLKSEQAYYQEAKSYISEM